MTGGDDDLTGLLPPQPPSAPARRDTVIAEAMQRFDRGPATDPTLPPRHNFRSRPQLAGLAIASLVILVGLPVAWLALDRDEFRAASGLDRTPIEMKTPIAPDQGAPSAASERLEAPAPTVAPRSADPASTRPTVSDIRARKSEISRRVPSPLPPPPSPPPPVLAMPAPAAPMAEPATRDDLAEGATRGFSISRSTALPRAAAKAASEPPPVRAAESARASNKVAARGRAGLAEDADVVVTGQRLEKGDEPLPQAAQALLDRGLARARAGDTASALADLDRAVRIAPRSAKVHFERGRLLRAAGEERRAKAEFARAAKLDRAFGDPGE